MITVPADRFSIDGNDVVVATGEIDIYSAPKLWEALSLVIERGRRDVVLDMAGVEFMDSQGIAVIVRALKHVRPIGGTVIVRSPRAQACTVLEISGLAALIQIEE
jgi:anti-sigma B factor antagonist